GKSFKYQREGNANFLGDIKSNETTEDWKGAETKLKAYTDIATGKKVPQTLEEAKEFIDDISTSKKEGNPQMFHLLPIDSLKSFLQMNLGTSTKFSTISQSRIHKIESIFDELDETYGKMKDIVEDINNTSSVPRKEQNMFHRHLQDMSNEIATVKESFTGFPRLIRGVDEIRELVLKVRTAEENPVMLDEKYNFIQENSISSRTKFDSFLRENNDIIERAKFLREFEGKGVKAASNKIRLNEIKRKNINKNTYIFYCSFERDQNSERINTFCKLINEQKPQDCFVIVEIDSWEGGKDEIPQTATIHLIVDGVIVDSDYNPNTRYLTKKDFTMEELENILKITGSYECEYTNALIQASCCVEIDNFTKETLAFVGYQEQHGWFIFDTKDKNISPGHRFVFHTQKQKMSLYGVAVMCAWKFHNSLISASWQIPLSSVGGLNSICFGITKPGINFDEVSQECLESLVKNKQGLVDDYYEGGQRSGHFISIKKRTFKKGVESESIKNNDICVSVRMTATSACNLSIQIRPRDVHNYAPELLKHVSV
uniref:Uncharacterized protein n=1 Tax=Panagrolaimus sp. ES5 TaxID=591445 RepID=A0AC34FZJ8_9BILA